MRMLCVDCIPLPPPVAQPLIHQRLTTTQTLRERLALAEAETRAQTLIRRRLIAVVGVALVAREGGHGAASGARRECALPTKQTPAWPAPPCAARRLRQGAKHEKAGFRQIGTVQVLTYLGKEVLVLRK